jgi:hypothetical protein
MRLGAGSLILGPLTEVSQETGERFLDMVFLRTFHHTNVLNKLYLIATLENMMFIMYSYIVPLYSSLFSKCNHYGLDNHREESGWRAAKAASHPPLMELDNNHITSLLMDIKTHGTEINIIRMDRKTHESGWKCHALERATSHGLMTNHSSKPFLSHTHSHFGHDWSRS